MEETVTLFRPAGPEELRLVEQSGFKRWPPRLPEQPIFYPVTNERYAIEIAVRWNVKDSRVGYVTRFQVRKTFMERYEIQQVGGSHHTEWWIPAEDLEELNQNIVGQIEIIGEYRAEDLSGLRTEAYFRERASRADIDEARRILSRAGKGDPPLPGDELP